MCFLFSYCIVLHISAKNYTCKIARATTIFSQQQIYFFFFLSVISDHSPRSRFFIPLKIEDLRICMGVHVQIKAHTSCHIPCVDEANKRHGFIFYWNNWKNISSIDSIRFWFDSINKEINVKYLHTLSYKVNITRGRVQFYIAMHYIREMCMVFKLSIYIFHLNSSVAFFHGLSVRPCVRVRACVFAHRIFNQSKNTKKIKITKEKQYHSKNVLLTIEKIGINKWINKEKTIDFLPTEDFFRISQFTF